MFRPVGIPQCRRNAFGALVLKEKGMLLRQKKRPLICFYYWIIPAFILNLKTQNIAQ